MSKITINKLTASNVAALKQARDTGELKVTLTATTATFEGELESSEDIGVALGDLSNAMTVLVNRHGKTGHPIASLHAPFRKLEKVLIQSHRH